MDGRWGPSIVQGWLDQVEAMDKWVGLFFADPLSVADPMSVEVIGPSYARLQPAWTRSTSWALTMSSPALFRSLAPGTNVAAIALMEGAFGNVVIARELVSPVVSYPTGGTFQIDADQWVVGIQVPQVA